MGRCPGGWDIQPCLILMLLPVPQGDNIPSVILNLGWNHFSMAFIPFIPSPQPCTQLLHGTGASLGVWNSLSQSITPDPSQSGIPFPRAQPHLSLEFPLRASSQPNLSLEFPLLEHHPSLWAEAENPHRFFQALLFLPGFLILEQHGATWVCELVLGTT